MACIELLSKDAQRKVGREEQLPSVDRHRFDELHEEGRRLIRGWAQRAVEQANCAEGASFEPFIFGWIALNGWACCVTGEERDSDYLDALLVNDDLARDFAGLLTTDLVPAAGDFESLWPIFSSKDLGYRTQFAATRAEAVTRYRSLNPPPAYKPACFFRHLNEDERVPLDWPHTLSAIYQIRCNLFHGYKGLHSENDVQLVSRAFRILAPLLQMLILGSQVPENTSR